MPTFPPTIVLFLLFIDVLWLSVSKYVFPVLSGLYLYPLFISCVNVV